MNFNIIGAGRLGKTLAYALINTGEIRLQAVCNEHFHQARLAIEHIGAGIAVSLLKDLPPVDLTFLTVNDDVISSLAKQLVKEKGITPGSIVAHCSGVLSSDALISLRNLGCQIASIHPLKAFKAGTLDKNAFKGCFCAVEGDEAAVDTLSLLFEKIGAKIIPIKPEAKTTYHAAAVIASNYLVTLAAAASELFEKAGVSGELSSQITTDLMQSSLVNIQQTPTLTEALTGPLLRGDLNTLRKHLDALEGTSLKALYCTAALATLPLTYLSEEQKTRIHNLINSQEEECFTGND
ncbi:Rossmann-like and DUF2520 domain-containing protein [Legionella fairfieldensis]|uniref:Rossmann-like and DUF2520 domain-containing protein n=1 Tax=Legionella fairfieldensis TaxID=45064 RepID=UPI00048AC20E|nr:Rossmann-like and DUF2520 domain-containing protein [Legionella fairfieldensis]